jgi:hypothetical protein
MTGYGQFVLAQALGEYGGMAGAIAAGATRLQWGVYWVEATLREPSSGVPLAIGLLIGAYLLVRRRK